MANALPHRARILDRYKKTAGQLPKLSPDGTVDLRDYDVVVLTGGRRYSRWHLTYPSITPPHFSADCATRVCEDVVRLSHHYRHWLSHTPAVVGGGPGIVSLPEPLLNEASPRIAAGEFNGRKFPAVENHYRKVLASFGSSLVSLNPEMLSGDANATSARFCNANLEDFVHVNDFGADIHFHALKARLESLATGSSVSDNALSTQPGSKPTLGGSARFYRDEGSL